MHIVHLTSVHRATDTRIFVKMCASLAREGHRVTLVAPTDLRGEHSGVRVIGVSLPKNRWDRMVRTTSNVWRASRLLDPDVMHFHDPELIPGALWMRLRGRRVVIDLHEDLPKQVLSKHWIPRALRGLVAMLCKVFLDFACRRMSGVVTATNPISDTISAKSVVVMNLPDLGEFEKPEIDYNARPKNVAYVGGLNSNRGLWQMLDAMGRTADGTALLMGGPFEPEQLEHEVMGHRNISRVSVLGYLARADVQRVLNRSRVGLVVLQPRPNYLESQPVKMYEYMGAGIPVVASDFPVWKEIVEGNSCGLCVDSTDPRAIAEAIDYLMSHPEEAERMGTNGRRAVEEHLNWSSQFDGLIGLYESLPQLVQ